LCAYIMYSTCERWHTDIIVRARREKIRRTPKGALVAATRGICEDVVGPDRCKVFVFGSVTTVIYLPSFDIILVMKVDVGGVNRDRKDCAEGESPTLDPLRWIHDALLVNITGQKAAEGHLDLCTNFCWHWDSAARSSIFVLTRIVMCTLERSIFMMQYYTLVIMASTKYNRSESPDIYRRQYNSPYILNCEDFKMNISQYYLFSKIRSI